MKVSVIVPNYNHARFLRQRIDSILAQTFQDFELILLDDCSTDESRSILSSYAGDPRVRIEFNNANSGSTFKQWNKGVRLARGEYAWIAESDDYADPHFLERLVPLLNLSPQIVFAYSRSWRVSSTGERNGFAGSHLSDLHPQRWATDHIADGYHECCEYLLVANSIPNASSVICRTAVYHQVGGADEELRLCGDWKLWASMALLGRIAYTAEPLNYFRTHNSSVRSETTKYGITAAEHMEVIRWLLRQTRPSPMAMQAMREWAAGIWIPAMTGGRVPFKRRLTIFAHALAIDREASRKLFRPLLAGLRTKLLQLLGVHGRWSEGA